jgi:hypothetical protein
MHLPEPAKAYISAAWPRMPSGLPVWTLLLELCRVFNQLELCIQREIDLLSQRRRPYGDRSVRRPECRPHQARAWPASSSYREDKTSGHIRANAGQWVCGLQARRLGAAAAWRRHCCWQLGAPPSRRRRRCRPAGVSHAALAVNHTQHPRRSAWRWSSRARRWVAAPRTRPPTWHGEKSREKRKRTVQGPRPRQPRPRSQTSHLLHTQPHASSARARAGREPACMQAASSCWRRCPIGSDPTQSNPLPPRPGLSHPAPHPDHPRNRRDRPAGQRRYSRDHGGHGPLHHRLLQRQALGRRLLHAADGALPGALQRCRPHQVRPALIYS